MKEFSKEPALFNISHLRSLHVTANQLVTATNADALLSKVYQYAMKSWPKDVSANLKPFFHKKKELTVEHRDASCGDLEQWCPKNYKLDFYNNYIEITLEYTYEEYCSQLLLVARPG